MNNYLQCKADDYEQEIWYAGLIESHLFDIFTGENVASSIN